MVAKTGFTVPFHVDYCFILFVGNLLCPLQPSPIAIGMTERALVGIGKGSARRIVSIRAEKLQEEEECSSTIIIYAASSMTAF